jgi:hypothetical protein
MNCYCCLLNLGGKPTSLYRKFPIPKNPSMGSSIEVHLRPRSSFSRRFNCLIQSSSCSIISGSVMSWVLDSSTIFVESARHWAAKRLHFGVNKLTVRTDLKAVDQGRVVAYLQKIKSFRTYIWNQVVLSHVIRNPFGPSLHRCTSPFNIPPQL